MSLLIRGTALALALCSTATAATLDAASVDRAATGSVTVHWTAIPADAPIDVYVGNELVSDDDRDGGYQLNAKQAAGRPLVRLKTAEGAELVTAERVLPLQGGRNFRDLGGYRTSDGLRVKWGRVFRSGTMSQLTDADYALLSSLGIRVVCDFRTNEEREREPTLWKEHDKNITYYTRSYSMDSASRSMFAEGIPTAATVRTAMLHLYEDLPYEHAESYRSMFESLAAGDVPLAFNCSAGKDRTGVAAALLLSMLGVPRATVVDDYALSERVVDFEAQFANNPSAAQAGKPGPSDFLAKLPADARAALLRSDPDYLRAALAAIERREGSLDRYYERVLQISSDERERIRKLLLEK